MDSTALIQFGLTVFIFFLKPGPAFIAFVVQSLRKGAFQGIAFGAGIVTASIFYFALAVSGYAIITGEFEEFLKILFQTVGGVLLIYIGVKGLMELSHEDEQEENTAIDNTKIKDSAHSFLTAFTLSIGNPLGIVLYLSILPPIFGDFVGDTALLVQGSLIILLAEMVPYIVLAFLIARYKKALSTKTLRIMNLVSSVIILVFGVFLALSTLPINLFENTYF